MYESYHYKTDNQYFIYACAGAATNRSHVTIEWKYSRLFGAGSSPGFQTSSLRELWPLRITGMRCISKQGNFWPSVTRAGMSGISQQRIFGLGVTQTCAEYRRNREASRKCVINKSHHWINAINWKKITFFIYS